MRGKTVKIVNVSLQTEMNASNEKKKEKKNGTKPKPLENVIY